MSDGMVCERVVVPKWLEDKVDFCEIVGMYANNIEMFEDNNTIILSFPDALSKA